MKTLNNTLRMVGLAGLIAVFAILSASCSDNDQQAAQKPFDHAHGSDVSDLAKHKFEHDFAEQCINREVAKSADETLDKTRYAKPCLCIAQIMMKNLTAKEAQKFLNEHKNTLSLQIRFENAAYQCLQKKAQPKAPTIFQRR